MVKLIRENGQGNKAFEEYASTLTLSLGQFDVQIPELIIKALLLLGMRASTKKRLMVEPDILNGVLNHMIMITSKYDNAGKSVVAMSEDTELAAAEENKAPWQNQGGKRVWAHPFTKKWYQETKEDNERTGQSDRPDCK